MYTSAKGVNHLWSEKQYLLNSDLYLAVRFLILTNGKHKVIVYFIIKNHCVF